MAGLYPFRRQWTDVVPTWLHGAEAVRLGYVLGLMIDASLDAVLQSMRHRLPGYISLDPLALQLLGRDRGLITGGLETTESYAVRLRSWLEAHRHRGSSRELLRQLRAIHGAEQIAVQVIARSGLRISMLENGEYARDEVVGWSPDDAPDHWARVWVIIGRTAVYNLIPDAATRIRVLDDLRALIGAFVPAHIEHTQVVVLPETGGLFDALPGPDVDVERFDDPDGGSTTFDDPSDPASAPITFAIGSSI